MPFYDYQCIDCNIIEEKFHSINSIVFYKCPKCNNIMHRLIGTFIMKFHGSGFYETDYKGKKQITETK